MVDTQIQPDAATPEKANAQEERPAPPKVSPERSRGISRRTFLHWSSATAATATLGGLLNLRPAFAAADEPTIAGLQAQMAAGQLTATALVQMYLERIDALDRRGPKVNSVIETNPDAYAIAAALDAERKAKGPRGPLHGIPILVKDNIDTADRMMTAAGSLALVGAAPLQDATAIKKLRDAGAIILGKANLSEWANFRSTTSTSGWSGRGGLCHNPYVLDRTACGSSSGSGAAVAANFCAVALGTETDGSVTCPSSICGIVGMKPTVGLISRAGVVPIAHSQDTIGPHARTVADLAVVLGAMTGVDGRDAATQASAGKALTDLYPVPRSQRPQGRADRHPTQVSLRLLRQDGRHRRGGDQGNEGCRRRHRRSR